MTTNPTRHTLPLAVLAAALVVSAAAPAHADFLVSIGGAEQPVTDEAYDYLSEDGFLSDSHLRLQVPILDGVHAGLEYNWAAEEFEPWDAVDTTLDLDTLVVTSTLSQEFFGFVQPYMTAGAGFTHAELDVTLGTSRREQDDWLFHGFLLGGVEVHLPRSWVQRFFGITRGSYAEDLTAGIYLEAGYRLVSTAQFDDLQRPEPDKEPEPEDRPLETSSLAVGELDLSGVMLRSGLLVRF